MRAQDCPESVREQKTGCFLKFSGDLENGKNPMKMFKKTVKKTNGDAPRSPKMRINVAEKAGRGEASAASRKSHQRQAHCTAFFAHGYHLMQAMRFGIEEINNSSTLLPNVMLGYEMFDTCSDSANIYGTLKILSHCTVSYIKMQNNFTQYKPKAIALIGPDSSSLSFTTSSILATFLVPQISYEATNQKLSIKQLYPSFLRTIPSDMLQVEVMLYLLQKFNWTWIAIAGSDDAYGRGGLQSLHSLAVNNGICVAYQGLIPDKNSTEVKQMLTNIMQNKIKVIVVFSTYYFAKQFFKEVVNSNVTDNVWIGSEDWSLSTEVSTIPNIKSIGTVLGVSVGLVNIPRLDEFEAHYVSSIKVNTTEKYDCNQACQYCQSLTLQTMSKPNHFDLSASFNVYSAVYTIAHGLHSLLDCESGQCSKDTFYPWQEHLTTNFGSYIPEPPVLNILYES
ncbi:taste receptor type 1 member 1-like [Discoglossus pictus]